MGKDEMIEFMKREGITFDDFSLGETLNGWQFRMGAFECYLENRNPGYDGIVASSIYESDLTK